MNDLYSATCLFPPLSAATANVKCCGQRDAVHVIQMPKVDYVMIS